MKHFDYIVIGGGIVGLSTAWALTERCPSARVAVLEKEDGWARHQTGRNSGVLHSGIYYKPGSLKASLCREGNRSMRRFCDEHGVRYEICGKLIVATKRSELPALNRLHERALINGLKVSRLHAADVADFEPFVHCVEGLHIPSTGIVNFAEVCEKLAELIQQRGGELKAGARADRICNRANEVVIETPIGEFSAGWVVNCAGLHSDRVARRSGVELAARIIPFRGEYYELKRARRKLVRGLIYPVPDPSFPFLGVHFTRMIDGSVHAGPNAVLSLKREGYERTSFDVKDALETLSFPGFWRLAMRHAAMGIEEIHRSFSKRAFVHSLQELIPEVQEDDLVECQSGVRAQALGRDGCLIDDFLIVRGDRTTHVCNAPSPAATASLQIGKTIAKEVPNFSAVTIPTLAI